MSDRRAPAGGPPPGAQRVALGIEYHGSAYHGWQIQRDASVATVQRTLQDVLTRIAAHPVSTCCAGRTDAGVHATGQVVHFDTTAERPGRAWVFGGNSLLPADICVRWAETVPDDFHARFSAQSRRYRYLIFNDSARPAAHPYQFTWHNRPLDAPRMHNDAQVLLGNHDFSSFRAAGCQSRSAVRDVREITVSRRGKLVVVDICADAFLMHMVRNIVGVLLAVGDGRRPPGWTAEVLAARDRRAGGVTAPAHGLYFVEVCYPARYRLARPPAWPFGATN